VAEAGDRKPVRPLLIVACAVTLLVLIALPKGVFSIPLLLAALQFGWFLMCLWIVWQRRKSRPTSASPPNPQTWP
jgi:Flp pilus assembly protein TadB